MSQKRRRSTVLILALALGLALWSPARPARAAVYTVDTTDEGDGSCSDGDCSLRDAIVLANDHAGPDTIAFDIDPATDPGCSDSTGVCVIQPDHWLPSLLEGGTTIDGYTQPGAAPATVSAPATVLIWIDGTNVTGNNGLNVLSAGNTIRGLLIGAFGYNGIAVGGTEATGNVIAGNYLGCFPSGDWDAGNRQNGVFVGLGATGNTVGGSAPADGNVISGNEWGGVSLHGADTSGNVVAGNYVGTDMSGTRDLGNTLDGVYIYGGAHDNWVGGDTAGAGNVIACNERDGVRVVNGAGNAISGNTIGLQPDGQTPCANRTYGITLYSAADTTVGGDAAGERNIISGNRNGVAVGGAGAAGNIICGNYIGTDAGGVVGLGNYEEGIWLTAGAHDNVVGGDTPDEGNLISGNRFGLIIEGAATTANVIAGNRIGTDFTGLAALGNGQYGLALIGGAHGNRIGGDTPGEGNVISANGVAGITIEGSHQNQVSGNYIGTDAAGTAALPGQRFNVALAAAEENVVGGTAPGEGNVISGATTDGIYLASGAAQNRIAGNRIGTDAGGTLALGNADFGIRLDGDAADNEISANVVSANGRCGIGLTGSGVSGNVLRGNIIGADASGSAALGNQGPGICLDGGSHNNVIGGAVSGYGNLIAANEPGIWLEGATGNAITANIIGSPADSPALGNLAGGVVLVDGACNNTIGPGNRIAYNEGDGVLVAGAASFANWITRNSITANERSGIHLDDGANHGILPPAILETLPGSVIIQGTACRHCDVELFASPTNEGEGLVFVASVEADAAGQYSLELAGLPHPYLTATATDPADGSSEFSTVHEYEPPLRYLFLPLVQGGD